VWSKWQRAKTHFSGFLGFVAFSFFLDGVFMVNFS